MDQEEAVPSILDNEDDILGFKMNDIFECRMDSPRDQSPIIGPSNSYIINRTKNTPEAISESLDFNDPNCKDSDNIKALSQPDAESRKDGRESSQMFNQDLSLIENHIRPLVEKEDTSEYEKGLGDGFLSEV